MNQNRCIELLEFSRRSLVLALSNVTEEDAKVVPKGFANSILWNSGHILLSVEQFIFVGTKRPSVLPAQYMSLFWRGTRPFEWNTEGPTLQIITSLIHAQTERVRTELYDKLDERLPTAMEFPGMSPLLTIGELLNMTLYHEALHVGYIKAMKLAIKSTSDN